MPPANARLDPDGRPYGWSFTCTVCGLVYVREECSQPDGDRCDRVMLAHLLGHEHAETSAATHGQRVAARFAASYDRFADA